MSKNDLCAEWVWIIQWILHFWIWDWEMRWRLQRKVLPLEALQMRVLLFVWFLSCSREAGKAGQGHKVMESGLLWSTVGHSNEADVFFSFISISNPASEEREASCGALLPWDVLVPGNRQMHSAWVRINGGSVYMSLRAEYSLWVVLPSKTLAEGF